MAMTKLPDWIALTGGDHVTLSGGKHNTLTAGNGSILSADDKSTLSWRYWDGTYRRIHTVYVGENGILPHTPYKGLYDKGVFTLSKDTP